MIERNDIHRDYVCHIDISHGYVRGGPDGTTHS
jgi:hypothetical protein